MTAAIGTGKGTVDLYDWENADAIWLMGDNAGSNAPRMITWLAEADRRGAQLVHINPLIEAASRRTIVPHEFVNMATFHTTKTGTMGVQVRIGGDMALIRGVAKASLRRRRRIRRCSIASSSSTTHTGSRSTALWSVHRVGGHSRRLRHFRSRNSQARRYLHRVKARHHRLVPRHHAARARRRYVPRNRQPAPPARQHRTRGSGPVPGPRAQQRAGQPNLRN